MNDNLKKLTGKNPRDFEPVAYSLINTPDVKLFEELVAHDDFLYDFVKQNVANRLAKFCNELNYKNLLKLLKYYSPYYEDFIVSTLASFADEDLTDTMLEIFENGSENEKTYCAKFFSYIQDPLALDLLRNNAYSENHALSGNCAQTLALMEDNKSYNDAIIKLNSPDEYEVLGAVQFLISYGKEEALDNILATMKKSPLAENIASEIPYLKDLKELLENNFCDGLYILNLIINGLGEISSLCQIFDFQLYEIFEHLLKNVKASTVLLNAYEKFNILTENDEYLYEQAKEVKQEVYDIKKMLSGLDIEYLRKNSDNELNQDSPFVFTALEFTSDNEKVRTLLDCNNQTLILKALEVLKKNDNMTQDDKIRALNHITNENIKKIISAI